jgi:CheY-like chemotaxis protein
VDDSEMTRKLVMRKLRSLGHSCVEAEDGVQAVSMVLKSLVGNSIPGSRASLASEGSGSNPIVPVIHLVLIDSNMPRMTGEHR